MMNDTVDNENENEMCVRQGDREQKKKKRMRGGRMISHFDHHFM